MWWFVLSHSGLLENTIISGNLSLLETGRRKSCTGLIGLSRGGKGDHRGVPEVPSAAGGRGANIVEFCFWQKGNKTKSQWDSESCLDLIYSSSFAIVSRKLWERESNSNQCFSLKEKCRQSVFTLLCTFVFLEIEKQSVQRSYRKTFVMTDGC